MASGFTSDLGPPDRTVRRAAIALAVGAIIAFGVVVVGSTFLAKQIARNEELAEAVRSADVLVRTVLASQIEAMVDGDAQAASLLDQAVRTRRGSGSLVYLEIADANGRVVYPPDRAGQLSVTAGAAPEGTEATLISADQARSDIGALAGGRMVEVIVPVRIAGDDARVLVYSTDDRLRTAEQTLSMKLVALAAGSVTLLLVLNFPISLWLLRKVGRARQEKVLMLSNEVAAADRERRNIARDLHDGVIQDLAGAGYALEAVMDDLAPEADEGVRRMLALSHDAVRRSTQALRTLIIEVAPPDLTSETLPAALEAFATRLGKDYGVDVDIEIDLGDPLGVQVTTLVYRSVRECLTNVVKHSGAKHARITIRSDGSDVYLVAEDDGGGFPSDLAERRSHGHLGLSLLAGTIADLGGRLTIDEREVGASVRCQIPVG